MNMPKNYEQTQTMGEKVEVQEGGHQLIIYEVSETMSKNNKPMIVVKFDFASGDTQAKLAETTYKDDISPEKKWPNFATARILVEDPDGNTSRNFKTFCTSVEHSNPGFKISWGEAFAACFRKKFVGAVFGPVENEYNGRIFTRNELRWFCAYDKAKEQKVPALKKISGNRGSVPAPTQENFLNPDGTMKWTDIPDSADDDGLPFN